MAERIIMPKQGLQMTEGFLTKWLKKEGETVKAGEPLFEMETDKLTITIDASAGGTLLKIVHPEGDTVPITETIAWVGEPGEKIPEEGASGETAPAEKEEKEQPETVREVRQTAAAEAAPAGEFYATPRAKMRAEERKLDITKIPPTGPDHMVIERDVLAYEPVKATPLARKEAELAGIPLEGISGSGVRGKIMAEDVRGMLQKEEEPVRIAPEPMTGIRRTIARHMKESLETTAQANHSVQVDMTACIALREAMKASGVKISYNDIVMYCAAKALTEFPMIHVRREGDAILKLPHVHMGMAVATDRGLMVPVIRYADQMRLSELAEKAKDLAGRTKDGTVQLDELSGSTFTVTNLGMYGIDRFVAIINAPESAILAVGAMKKQPVVLPDDTLGIRPMMWLTLTYDHCIIDGAPAAQFLARIRQLLENPMLML